MAQKKILKVELAVVDELKKLGNEIRILSSDAAEYQVGWEMSLIVQKFAPTWNYVKATRKQKEEIDAEYNKILSGLKEFGFAVPTELTEAYTKIKSGLDNELDFISSTIRVIIREQQ